LATFLEKNEKNILIFLQVILIAAIIGLLTSSGTKLTGYDTLGSTSTVSIQNYISIARSANLTDGINFGSINTLPSWNTNATANYNSSNQSMYFISVSTDSNLGVDFCFKAVTIMSTSTGIQLALGNYTWSNSTLNNWTHPVFPGTSVLTTSYVAGAKNVPVGNNIYFRFWLNVTTGTSPGTYNNSVTFQGVATGSACS